MELGKLIIFGVLGLLVLNLWNGSGTASTQKETENAAAVVATETIEEMSESLPQTHTIPPYQALTPADVPDTHDEANARAVDRYATYEYVRPRDPGTQNTYSYRVEGVDAYGTSVEGSVNTRGILGNGYLTTEHGDHIWIVTEWTDHGTLLGFDAEENTYVLSTSEIR